MFNSLAHSVYFAPRGKDRLLSLGNNMSQSYLSPNDKLIGLIGDAGAGKSLLIKGMFPGLILTNDDQGINIRPLPILSDYQNGNFNSHTYHVDMRFETAFTQSWQLGQAIKQAIKKGKRVIVEHYNLLEKHLSISPEILIGIGEEVIITKPGVFGPYSKEISNIVFKSIKYRRMAHTAEDLTTIAITKRGYRKPPLHSDVKSGFILLFEEKPDFSIKEIEDDVKGRIQKNEKVSYVNDNHIKIGESKYKCTGPRIHLHRTAEVESFRLLPNFKIDFKTNFYLLTGFVGTEHSQFKLSSL